MHVLLPLEPATASASLGSDPPFAATGTKVGLGPITTHVHTNYC